MPKYYELRDFSASVQTKCLHAIRDIRIAWRHFLNSVFEYISRVRGIRKFFSSLQSVGQGLGFSSHSDSEFPLPHNAPERIRQCSSRRIRTAPILAHQYYLSIKAALPVAPKIDFLRAVTAPYELTFFVFSGFLVCWIRCPDTSNQLLIRSVFVLK